MSPDYQPGEPGPRGLPPDDPVKATWGLIPFGPGPYPPPGPAPVPVFGPTFADEIAAAGLNGLRFTWNSDGEIFGREFLSEEQNATLDRVIAAHDPRKTAVPPVISRRQFFQVAAMPMGGRPPMITQVEALDAVRHGEIPMLMLQGLEGLPPNEKFAAEMLLSGASEFDRHHPLVAKFGEIMGLTSAQLDDIWRYAATL